MARNKTNAAVEETPSPEPPDRTLFQAVADYLQAQDWNPTPFEQERYFWLTMRLRDGSVSVIVDATSTPDWARLQVFATLPVHVPRHRHAALAEALHRINRRTLFGSFDLNYDTREVRARAMLEGDNPMSTAMIERAVRGCLELADEHYAAILAVAFGDAAPQNVVEMAGRGEGVTLQ